MEKDIIVNEVVFPSSGQPIEGIKMEIPITSGTHINNIMQPSSGQPFSKKLNICIYSTQVIPTNPDLDMYGGLELIAGLQAKHFDEMGHTVHLFGCKGSWKPPNGHVYIVGDPGTNPVAAWKAYWDDPRTRMVLKEADIVVDHSWQFYPYAAYSDLKHICHVWHGPDPGFREKPPFPQPSFIAISFCHAKWMMKMAPGTNWWTVHNGIPLYKYTFNDKPLKDRERLLWLSRIYSPKGGHRAIDIADKLKMPIDIVGGSFGDRKEYLELIKKKCEESQYATFHGEVSFAKKLEFYQNAKCVLLPIVEHNKDNACPDWPLPNWEWHEPFGLITAEAGACGTPTIVTPNGGWMESMIHGYNGFFANTDDEFAHYVKQIENIKPKHCREIAERFDYKIMGENYLKIFKQIIEGGGW